MGVKDGLVPSPTLKLAQLKRLAFLCGLSTTATKPGLIKALGSAVNEQQNSQGSSSSSRRREIRVLSIDPGIVNLAYSLVTSATPSGEDGTGKRSSPSKEEDEERQLNTMAGLSCTLPLKINLHAWERFSLVPQIKAGAVEAGEIPGHMLRKISTGAYEPRDLAATTNRLIFEKLLPLRPTHILLERQRWRTGGGLAVQEWTLRVNSFVAMLFSSLQTLKMLGRWNGVVLPVQPERVGGFWTESAEFARAKKTAHEIDKEALMAELKVKERTGTKSQRIKKAKIQILKEWLAQGDIIHYRHQHGDGFQLPGLRQFLYDQEPSRRSKRKGKSEEARAEEGRPRDVKLDDLTDCLLQGMAWFRWQENKKILAEEGGIIKLLGSPITKGTERRRKGPSQRTGGRPANDKK